MAQRSVPPSNLSLLVLVRHLAETERVWFRQVMAGQDAPAHYPTRPSSTVWWPDPAMVEQAWATWRSEVAFAERFVDETPDLGITGKNDTPLREVLIHMIVEYARHNGHADFLRERIDGHVGQ
jgi:hypothetical protein